MRVAMGDRPWHPTDALVVEVTHRYDIPLEGVLEQDGCRFIFRCVYGETSECSAWVYTPEGGGEAVVCVATETDGVIFVSAAEGAA